MVLSLTNVDSAQWQWCRIGISCTANIRIFCSITLSYAHIFCENLTKRFIEMSFWDCFRSLWIGHLGNFHCALELLHSIMWNVTGLIAMCVLHSLSLLLDIVQHTHTHTHITVPFAAVDFSIIDIAWTMCMCVCMFFPQFLWFRITADIYDYMLFLQSYKLQNVMQQTMYAIWYGMAWNGIRCTYMLCPFHF